MNSRGRIRKRRIRGPGWGSKLPRSLRALASCAADGTRELTTHASYRALLSDISGYISNTLPPPASAGRRQRASARRLRGKRANIVLNEAPEGVKGGGYQFQTKAKTPFRRAHCRVSGVVNMPGSRSHFFVSDYDRSISVYSGGCLRGRR